jgi:hypothetical protein
MLREINEKAISDADKTFGFISRSNITYNVFNALQPPSLWLNYIIHLRICLRNTEEELHFGKHIETLAEIYDTLRTKHEQRLSKKKSYKKNYDVTNSNEAGPGLKGKVLISY